MADARQTALQILLRVESGGGYSNLVIARALRDADLDARARAFCSALVRGVLERCVTLDFLLTRCVKRPLEKLDLSVLCILRMGAYQLYYMGAVPDSAAVDESVKLCRTAGKTSAGALVNGALRTALRSVREKEQIVALCTGDACERLALEMSVPPALCAHLIRCYGMSDTRRILENALLPAPLYIRVNTLRTNETALTAALEREQVHVQKGAFPGALALAGVGALEELQAFREGLFHVQDISSQRCAMLLEVASGMRVLDACAAPGGKSFTIAQEMRGEGLLTACDIHAHKMILIDEGARRLGLSNITAVLQDARNFNQTFPQFDRILCDVPCSGLGVIRRRPEIRRKNLESFGELPEIQYKILENTSKYMGSGGELIYSTCTLNSEENEKVVERFLCAHSSFEGVRREVLGGYCKTFLPREPHDGDGFFIAVLRHV